MIFPLKWCWKVLCPWCSIRYQVSQKGTNFSRLDRLMILVLLTDFGSKKKLVHQMNLVLGCIRYVGRSVKALSNNQGSGKLIDSNEKQRKSRLLIIQHWWFGTINVNQWVHENWYVKNSIKFGKKWIYKKSFNTHACCSMTILSET